MHTTLAVVASPAWVRTTYREDLTVTLAVQRGAQKVRTVHQESGVWGLPWTYYSEEEIKKSKSPQTGQSRLWRKPQALELRGFLACDPPVSLPLGSLPFPLCPSLSSTREVGGRLEGEMAGPRDPQDSPSLRCHGNAAPIVHAAQSSDSLFQREARLASALILHGSTFSQRPGRGKRSGGNETRWATPQPGGLPDSSLPLHLRAFVF